MFRREGHGNTNKKTLMRALSSKLFSTNLVTGAVTRQHSFDYMFSDWEESDRLDAKPETLANLKILGSVMKDTPNTVVEGSIPAAYTYFGQFVDHDVTFDEDSASIAKLAEPTLTPLHDLAILKNSRAATLELDSVYFSAAPRDSINNEKLKIGENSPLNGTNKPILRPEKKSKLNDLPRTARNIDPQLDRAAEIGDPRNDENIIVAQLHTAFLKAHNTFIDSGLSFEEAKKEIILRYQSVVLDDFLSRVCDPEVHQKVLTEGPSHWIIEKPDDLFMPVEFAYAAYRFGHSMVRTNYNYNLNFENTGLDTLFTFTALSGQIGGGVVNQDGFDTVPDNWIIQWERLIELPSSLAVQNAHPIDTQLTNFLFNLRDTFGNPQGQGDSAEVTELAPILAKRNLLRGFLVGLPTGQAMAKKLGIPPLQGQELVDALPTVELKQAIIPFKEKTPLWFYILAEAGDVSEGAPAGKHLGKVGSTILMETFHNLIKHSPISILDGGNHGTLRPFTLAMFLELAAKQDPTL